MGSANALAAYRLYGGKIPPVSLNVLAYMALVALDKDKEPAWWEGHEMLAIRCFGRPEPVGETDLRAVRRAITPLFGAGAITTIRHGSGTRGRLITVRYRLWLDQPAPDGKRPKQAPRIGRKVVVHRTESDRAPDGIRPPKEEEEKEERDIYGGPVACGTVEGARSNGAAPVENPDTDISPEEAKRVRMLAELAEWERQQSEADRYSGKHAAAGATDG